MQISYFVAFSGRYLSAHACRCWKVLAYAALVYDKLPIRIPVIVPTANSVISIFLFITHTYRRVIIIYYYNTNRHLFVKLNHSYLLYRLSLLQHLVRFQLQDYSKYPYAPLYPSSFLLSLH
jgi:hypothetical protein